MQLSPLTLASLLLGLLASSAAASPTPFYGPDGGADTGTDTATVPGTIPGTVPGTEASTGPVKVAAAASPLFPNLDDDDTPTIDCWGQFDVIDETNNSWQGCLADFCVVTTDKTKCGSFIQGHHAGQPLTIWRMPSSYSYYMETRHNANGRLLFCAGKTPSGLDITRTKFEANGQAAGDIILSWTGSLLLHCTPKRAIPKQYQAPS